MRILTLTVLVVVVLLTLPMPASAKDFPEDIPQVALDKQPTDPGVLKALQKAGVDKRYVELKTDYGKRGTNKSPYSQTWKDRKSDTYVVLTSSLPMTDARGNKLRIGWLESKGRYYTESTDKSYNNLFWAEASGSQIRLVVKNDQPDGTLMGAEAVYTPQLFIGGNEIRAPPTPILLPIDPVNENYQNNVLEWNYDNCIRRIRVIEGRYFERWILKSNPNDTVQIKHNFAGTLELELGYAADAEGNSLRVSVIGDSEIVEASEFDEAVFPVEIGASLTVYPDADPETTSVDGCTGRFYTAGESWADLRTGSGTEGSDTPDNTYALFIYSDDESGKWRSIYRGGQLFYTAALPDSANISATTLSLRGRSKVDDLGITPSLNIYSFDPASDDDLIAADYETYGSTAYCDTAISYASWDTTDYNDFILNATGIAAVSKTGVSKFGNRDAVYDAGGATPSWSDRLNSELRYWTAEKGEGYKPTLVITYTALPTVTTQAASDVEDTTATGNGNITNIGSANCTRRGIVWDTTSYGDPGNVSPAVSDYDNDVGTDGNFGTGAFTESLTSLPTGDTIYARAYAQNEGGYNYGGEVSFLTKPAAPTNVAATDGDHTDKVVITWTKSTGATGYKVYEGANLLDTLGDVATYDDSTAPAGTIDNAGTASASDGTFLAHVVLSLAGESTANGTSRTYKVVALNATGDSDDSTTDAGYRSVGAITYQWQRSAADSDENFSNIAGGTTDPYNDTGAPANGDGRYFQCIVSSVGASNSPQTSTSDRGCRAAAPTVTTEACSGFDLLWAIVNGEITNTGSALTTTVGFDYGLTTSYGSEWTSTGSWNTGDEFWAKLFPLTPATLFHYRAKAYNGFWGYGGDKVFSTKGSPTLYEYLNTGGDGDSEHIYSGNWTAEQFTSDNVSHTITSVRIPLKRVGTSPNIVTLSITRANSDNFSTGADLSVAYLNGDAMTTSYVWYDFDIPDITLDASSKYAIVVRATAGTATDYMLWQKDSSGGIDNAVGSHSQNSGITWTTDSPADYLFEIWGETVISVEGANVFSDYIEDGDWLIALTYKNMYTPYYPDEDTETYFNLQFIDNTTVKAQVSCPAWGYRPGSIYLSKSLADTLDWGSTNFKVRLIGNFTGNPNADYALTALDWKGDELTFLDRWVIAQANAIGTYDGTTLTVDVADKGELLNDAGHVMFSIGIPELNIVRPDLFETVTRYPTITTTPGEHTLQESTDWETRLGPQIVVMLNRAGALIGQEDGRGVGGALCFVGFLIVVAILAAAGQLVIGLCLGYPVLLSGAWFGLLDWTFVGLVAFAMIVVFAYIKFMIR